jgi:hypothetical protein
MFDKILSSPYFVLNHVLKSPSRTYNGVFLSFASSIVLELLLLPLACRFGDRRERSPKVDVATAVQGNGLFIVTILKCLLERRAQEIAALTNLDLRLLLQIVSLWYHLRWPHGRA